MDNPADTAEHIASEIAKGLSSDNTDLHSVVQEIHDYQQSHSSPEFMRFYRDLNFELMNDQVLPSLLLEGYNDSKGIELHQITEELDRDLLLSAGSTKYDTIAKDVEQHYRDIVQLSTSSDPASTQQALMQVYNDAKADLLPLSNAERAVYSTMLRNIILAHPEVADYMKSDEFTQENFLKFQQIINGANIKILSTDPNQSADQVSLERVFEALESMPSQMIGPFGPFGQPGVKPAPMQSAPKVEPTEPTAEPFGTWT